MKQQLLPQPRDARQKFDNNGELYLEPKWLKVSEAKDKSTRRGATCGERNDIEARRWRTPTSPVKC